MEDILAAVRMVVLLKDENDVANVKKKIDAARAKYKESMAKLTELETSEKWIKLLRCC